MSHKTGGFFALEIPLAVTQHSVLSLWDMGGGLGYFTNARSAFHWLLQSMAPRTVWLPAYCCRALAQAVPEAMGVRYFPLGKNLSPDCDYLRKHVAAGDLVLAIDYFGRNPEGDFLELVTSMPEVTWVEDRAQAMQPAARAWGEYVLYSPRKLLGVADGGILASRKALDFGKQESIPSSDFIRPSLLRYEDVDETHNGIWYAAFREKENNMGVSAAPMSRLSHAILASTDARPLMQARRSNFAVLMELLHDVVLLPPEDKNFVPLGFPVRLKESRHVASQLHAQGIFAANHWPDMPSDSVEFANEHALAAEILTLPVDHRYGRADMELMAQLVKSALS